MVQKEALFKSKEAPFKSKGALSKLKEALSKSLFLQVGGDAATIVAQKEAQSTQPSPLPRILLLNTNPRSIWEEMQKKMAPTTARIWPGLS